MLLRRYHAAGIYALRIHVQGIAFAVRTMFFSYSLERDGWSVYVLYVSCTPSSTTVAGDKFIIQFFL